jgi:hypothetical protein
VSWRFFSTISPLLPRDFRLLESFLTLDILIGSRYVNHAPSTKAPGLDPNIYLILVVVMHR